MDDNAVHAELVEFLNFTALAHSFACHGLRLVEEEHRQLPRDPDHPDPYLFVGQGDPNTWEAKFYATCRMSEIPDLVAAGGPVEVLLGQQWAVHVYSAWEKEYRPRVAAAAGIDVDDVRVSEFGDLRRMRNDIIHNRGIATSEWTGRCEVFHWFAAGDVIEIDVSHIRQFVNSLGLGG